MNRIINRLLSKNISRSQLIGFMLANVAGLAIVILGIQFFEDARPIWEDEDSFIRKDYVVINKRVTSANTFGNASSAFTEADIADIEKQPWVRKVGRFTSADYGLSASVAAGGRQMSTYMFFESIPSEFIDVADNQWTFHPGDKTVPIIISKDYLSLYNFGFAGSAGMSQISEQTISGVPLALRIRPDNGRPEVHLQGMIVGFSNRLNTILVPQEFMEWSNAEFSSKDTATAPSRLIIDVSSPGDVAIPEYMKVHAYEIAGDKGNSTATYLVNVITAVGLAVGVMITLLSFFILLLSISLLMQKNRDKMHSLIMLGFDLKTVARPYERLVIAVNFISWLLAGVGLFLFRSIYLVPMRGMGAAAGSPLLSLACGLALATLITIFNIISIRRKVRTAF